ncbi:arylesterase [Cerasicoccus arenae]|nr:arylesterase [Cerasicoccus arenae]MBK1858166.1 arylesterase [Cerasicoccus arenae]
MTTNNAQIRPSWRRSLAALFAISLGLLTALLSPKAEARPETIMLYGDSLTAAHGLSRNEGYPALIQQKIEAAGLASDYVVQASAISGETSAGGLNRIKWSLAGLERSQQKLGVFMLALGANDGLRGQSINAMKANLQGILDLVKEKHPDARLIVAGMFMPPNMGDDYRARFSATFDELAEANHATLIPFLLEGVAGNRELNLPDGIHPNAKGQQVIADNLWVILEPMLEEPVMLQP